MRVEVRTTPADKARWQALAEARGLSLSDLVRALLDGQRPRAPSRSQAGRAPLAVEPALLRELARLGNNLNQLAHAANRAGPVPAAALLVRLIEIDRELGALRRAHERPAEGRAAGEGSGASEAVAEPVAWEPVAPQPTNAEPASAAPVGAVTAPPAPPAPPRRKRRPAEP